MEGSRSAHAYRRLILLSRLVGRKKQNFGSIRQVAPSSSCRRFRREARARERHQHSIGGSSESGFAAVGPSGHTISPHPSSREGHHDSQEQKLKGPRCAAASIRSRYVVVFGERHLREVLQSYANYYNQARTHLSLNKDAPVTRSIETDGRILAVPILGGLHRRDRQPRTIAA